MFKFFSRTRDRSSGHLKDKLGKDLFLFNKAVEHGFPPKPSAIAHDPELNLLAIGTSNGLLKIYGRPGVELSASHQNETVIQELHFLPEQGRIISVCDDGEQNTIHLWEVNKKEGKSVLEEVKTCTLEGRLKKISVCCLSMKSNRLYLGTEGGNIYLLDINSFELQEYIIYQDVVMQSVQEESKTNAGSVEAIQEHPDDSNKILIGYKKGLVVLWNHAKCSVQATFSIQSSEQPQEVESVSWHSDGTKFISAHGDGSLTKWSLERGPEIPKAVTPLGPFPCKAITKVEWSSSSVFFSGGMPRASYGDRHCVCLIQDANLVDGGDNTPQVAFDFTSRVVDFFTVKKEGEEPAYLVVLCEEELVVIDLVTKEAGFPTFMKPYLVCLHSSPITCSSHSHDCPPSLFDQIANAGTKQLATDFSQESWPITGGKTLIEEPEGKDLLITGHEDGSVNFWDVSHLEMCLIYTLNTAKYFVGEHEGHDSEAREAEEEVWPPFKKVGNYCPYSDDPRFAVTKIVFCASNKTMTVAGNGGQVLTFDLSEEETSVEVQMEELDFTEDKENFQWKGHGPLLPKEGSITVPAGFKLQTGLQLIPAAPVSALAVDTRWGLIAAGTVHGFVVYDCLNKKMVTSKWTVSQETDSGEHLSRKKSLKESIRRSFRRLRSRKGSRSGATPKKEGEAPASPTQEAVATPVSRLVEESRVDESVLSMVRCLYFVDTYIKDGVHHCPSLWAGTNAGHIFVCYLTIPEGEKRTEEEVQVEIGKEIKLKHKAPVVSMFVVDKEGTPLLSDIVEDQGKEPDMSGTHSLVICSEEQFKVFSLPHLKARNKEKLTAIDGSRVRKIGLINVRSKNDDSGMVYHCLACVSNQGELIVYSLPNLKVQVKASAMRKSDVDAIKSLVFSVSGQGFYLSSRSEMQRFTLSATDLLKPDCVLELAEGMRPPEPEPETVAEEEEKKSRKSSTSSSSSSSSSSDDEKDEEKKKAKKEKKEKKKKAKLEAAAVAATATEVETAVSEEVEEKKEEAEEKKEEAEEKKDELVAKADDAAAVVVSGEGGTSVTERVVISEQRSFTHQSSTSEEKEAPEKVFGEESSTFSSTMESSSSFTTTTRVVTSKQVVSSSSTTQRIITSEGTTFQAIENGESEKLMLNDSDLQKAAEEMVNDAHDEVEQASS
ncbi:Lethal(2) giant larvae protein 1 [Porites harrisoni]